MTSALRFLVALGAFLAAAYLLTVARARGDELPQVDVVLVLLADVSDSMSDDDLALQRGGYATALASPEFVDAVESGWAGRVAVTYVHWADVGVQAVVVPWAVVEDSATAAALGAAIWGAPVRAPGVSGNTGLGSAVLLGVALVEAAPFRAIKAVVDVSGDGKSNVGPGPAAAREMARELGITINGLSVGSKKIEDYYWAEVVSGPGAFVYGVADFDGFAAAVQRKLALEVTAASGPRR